MNILWWDLYDPADDLLSPVGASFSRRAHPCIRDG